MAGSGKGERCRKREVVKDEEADLLAFLEKKRLKLEEEERQPKTRPEPELLEALAKVYNDFTEPVWLGQKRMTKTDIRPHHHQRFFVPRSVVQKLKPHLKCWEREEIEPHDGPGIYVSVMDPLGWRRELKLKRWPSLKQWALLQGWQMLVDVNELREGDHIVIWACRPGPNNQLGLILQRIPRFSTRRTTCINIKKPVRTVVGGLVSAYDFSGDKICLDKAKDIADMLLPAWNTPLGLN